MDTTTYVALSRQLVLQRQLDVTANNLANMDTPGFKLESLMVQTDPENLPTPKGSGGPAVVNFVLDGGVARDFSAGPVKITDAPLDLAIKGQGFFTINTPAGPRYTRDGRFDLDANGQIVTKSGLPVLGEGGPVIIDPKLGQIHIAADGTISQKDQVVGKISLVSFASLSGLSKQGDGLYDNVSNTATQASTATMLQGAVESSNVEPMTQMTQLIKVNNAYAMVSQMLVNVSDLSRSAVDRLGRIS
jgi:flagellar basal-body rod protein FlgF